MCGVIIKKKPCCKSFLILPTYLVKKLNKKTSFGSIPSPGSYISFVWLFHFRSPLHFACVFVISFLGFSLYRPSTPHPPFSPHFLQIVKEKFKRKKYRECFFIPHTSLLLSHPSKWFKLIQNFNNSKFNFFLAFALYFVFKDATIIKRIRGGWMLLC